MQYSSLIYAIHSQSMHMLTKNRTKLVGMQDNDIYTYMYTHTLYTYCTNNEYCTCKYYVHNIQNYTLYAISSS